MGEEALSSEGLQKKRKEGRTLEASNSNHGNHEEHQREGRQVWIDTLSKLVYYERKEE